MPNGVSPPHSDYWEADRCSKTLKGCKFRWGSATNVGAKNINPNGGAPVIANPFLPFGGFPGTNTKVTVQ